MTTYDTTWTLYEDKDIIIVNKPGTVPVQNDRSPNKSLYKIVQEHLGCDLQMIHRLDQPVSGACVFAKHLKAAVPLFEQFEQRTVQKIYYAIVDKCPEPKKDTIISYLEKNTRKNRSFSHPESRPNTKKAILDYELIGTNDNFFLLKVNLHTGRHHQIRAQLAAIDCCIRGDAKYGFRRSNKDRTINLHGRFLTIAHPMTRQRISVVAPFPDEPIWSSFKSIEEEEVM